MRDSNIVRYKCLAAVRSLAMVQTKTAGGSIERGNATARHFGRITDNEVDGARVLSMLSARDKVLVTVTDDGQMGSLVRKAVEMGATIEETEIRVSGGLGFTARFE